MDKYSGRDYNNEFMLPPGVLDGKEDTFGLFDGEYDENLFVGLKPYSKFKADDYLDVKVLFFFSSLGIVFFSGGGVLFFSVFVKKVLHGSTTVTIWLEF